MSIANEPDVCPICQGTGILVHIDEEVCCQVELPCWACESSRHPRESGDPEPRSPGKR